MWRLFSCLLVLSPGLLASHPPPDPAGVTEVSVACRSDEIRVSIATDGDFEGMVYPRGLSENSSCLARYARSGSRLEYRLPLHSCNTMSSDQADGVEYFNTVVVQPHPRLVTGLGRGFHVRCKYRNRKKTLDWDGPVGDAGTTPVAVAAPLPAVTMKILRGESDPEVAEHAKIGDSLTLVVALDSRDTYGMKVTNCIVRDGLNWAEQPLINNEGCPLDEEVMGPLVYDADKSRASVTFPAHKFPYAPSVYYQCNVKLCLRKAGGCPDVPPRCDDSRRSKRRAGEIEQTGSLRELLREQEDPKYLNVEVYSGLYVDEAEEPEPSAKKDDGVRAAAEREDDFCVSTKKFAVGMAVAGALLMLAVLLLIACILHRRRRRKGTSTAGSSIYSGPYSNRAYSRD